MNTTCNPYHTIAANVTEALCRHVPERRDDAWLVRLVDEPRFGWDWESLERGFLEPLRAFSLRHASRLRPILSASLIDALGGDYHRHGDVLAALELHYIAAIMMDDVRNGRDLASSQVDQIDIPLPVWVTIAYNARQLAPVMIYRDAHSLDAEHRRWLAVRFGGLLFSQGIGTALDLWGSEQQLTHADADHLVEHLRVYIGTLTFGLACDVASACTGISEDSAHRLARAGRELGVAVRLAALAAGENATVRTLFGPVREQTIRWSGEVDRACISEAAEKARARALSLAGEFDGAVARVFERFLREVYVGCRVGTGT